MDISYRADSPQTCIHPADLEMTWIGESGQGKRLKPQPLNTARLKSFQQITRGATLSILETGHVSIELQKKKGEQERAMELFVVSGDGQEICVEQWKADNTDLLGHKDTSDRTWRTFTFDNLPEKYWKKYSHAYRFVDLVKSKTAKVTMYSDRAKGVLMENWPPNFEVTFFQGPKIVMSGNEIQIKEETGASLVFHRDTLNNLVNNYSMDLIQHATQMREQCLRLEASVTTVQAVSQGAESLFPITVGMRPSTSFCSSTSSNSGSIDFLTSPRFNHLHSSQSSGSQGHISPASTPPSPVPQIDLRLMETSRKFTPSAHSTPARDSCVTTQSPFRHLSTLEGRKLRRQTSDSTDSDCVHHDGADDAANLHTNYGDSHQLENREQSSEGHTLSNSFCRAGMEQGLHHLQATPLSSKTNGDAQIQQNFITSSTLCSTGQNAPQFITQSASKGQAGNMMSPAATGRMQVFLENASTGSIKNTENDGSLAAAGPVSDLQTILTSVGKNSKSADNEVDEQTAVIRQTFVPYTGWAALLVNGTIWIRYSEGTQLGLNRNQTEVVYVDQQGNIKRYLQADKIPDIVRQKLEKVPSVVQSLYNRPVASPYGRAST